MTWLGLVTAVAVGNEAAPLAGFFLRVIGLVVLVAMIIALWG